MFREIREMYRKEGIKDEHRVRGLAKAASSVRDFPVRIYNAEQLEACASVGPYYRKVQNVSTSKFMTQCGHSISIKYLQHCRW